jgi:hypothetical protein
MNDEGLLIRGDVTRLSVVTVVMANYIPADAKILHVIIQDL